ncbi:hypothetical protein FNF29_07637 [Cafeteria roenbergensis]|uniref:NADH dehydrogenase [ubiquinone] 1 beta subcomplex subunit 9 n=1 Tax=Cafeteria roenbergensis TaxID=33653 RepID=A0A5A8C4H9_CAFRO|nr:hypothetical protein FNF29_07637 [Cafeteria roenbergensis]|eukprot:KAA0147010.1 hypothetical protein FNF29_07637 [Cafeteria roenbergensis]
MNQSFREVTRASVRGAGALSHAQRATRLYRRALRQALDWGVTRENFYILSAEIRAKFEETRHLSPESSEAAVLLRKGEEQSGDYTHPDSYAIPTMPGGSKFMRNPPPPLQAVFPDGIPEEADIAPQTLEGIQVPMSATPEGYDKILVFPYSKSAQGPPGSVTGSLQRCCARSAGLRAAAHQEPAEEALLCAPEGARVAFYSLAVARGAAAVAAVGAGGTVTVFPGIRSTGVSGLVHGQLTGAGLRKECVATWQGHSRWVSDVALLSRADEVDPCLAVTSSDDGFLRLWGLTDMWMTYGELYREAEAEAEAAEQAGGGLEEAFPATPDPVTGLAPLAEASPHDGSGVYALSVAGGRLARSSVRVATAGKDGCVAVSAGSDMRRVWTAHGHKGVAKAVACRPGGGGELLASAGNDKRVLLWDSRLSGQEGPVVSCGGDGYLGGGAHLLAVNKLVWAGGGFLVSGSFDNTLAVWDPRLADRPVSVVRTFGALSQARQPVAGRPKRAGAMLQPVLLRGGAAVAVAVDGTSKLRTLDVAASGWTRAADTEAALECATMASDGVSLIAVARSRYVHLVSTTSTMAPAWSSERGGGWLA